MKLLGHDVVSTQELNDKEKILITRMEKTEQKIQKLTLAFIVTSVLIFLFLSF